MTELRILRGVPASGKSTTAQEFRRRDWAVVNRDSIRFSLFGKYWGVNEDVVTSVEDAAIEAALRAGQDTVVDATNLRAKNLRTKLSLASRYGATVTYEDFLVSQDVAIYRDSQRERRVGEDVIRGFFKRYKINTETGVLPPAPEPLPVFEPYVPNLNKPVAYIVDTDGTVADHESVRGIYDASKYHLDKVREHVASVVYGLDEAGFRIIGLSGRDEAYMDVTRGWWDDNSIPFYQFYMRPAGDKRMDAIIKYELFKKYIEPHYNVFGAFDDRPQVIRMWETIGVPVFDVGNRLEF